MKCKDLAMHGTEKSDSKQLTQVNTEGTPVEVLRQPSENLCQDLDRSIALIDSTGSALHSYMRGMFANQPAPEIRTLDVEKVQTAALMARSINELMRTKLEIIKTYDDMTE